jgi:hypothetical protein
MPKYGANNLDRDSDRRAEFWFHSGVLQPHLLSDLSDQPRLVRQGRLALRSTFRKVNGSSLHDGRRVCAGGLGDASTRARATLTKGHIETDVACYGDVSFAVMLRFRGA